MISQTIFRAYDIRGVVGVDLSADAVELIGRGFGTFLKRQRGLTRPRVVAGRDGRTHSPELFAAFTRGLLSTGADVTATGLSPSPLLYFSNTTGGFDAGCNLTASHNPAEYNGFKLVAARGHAIYGDDLQTIYKIIQSGDFETGEGTLSSDDFFERYTEKLKSMFRFSRPLKVVADTGNGVAGAFYPQVLRALGHDVVELFTALDGTFPNHEPDPIVEKNTTALKAKVTETCADIGLAFDGDGDRVGVVTQDGHFISADRTLMLLTRDVLSRHPGGTLVYTVSNSQQLFDLAARWGGKPVLCPVGHSYVENAMQKNKAVLGGEQSGHFFLPEDYYGFDDALVTACRLLKILSDTNQTISQLFDAFPTAFSRPEMRPKCADDCKFTVLQKVRGHFSEKYPCNTLDGVRVDFGEGAWAGIRASNTSPCLSVILEAGSPARLREIGDEVLGHLRSYPEIEW